MTHARAPRLGIGVKQLGLATAGTAAMGLEHVSRIRATTFKTVNETCTLAGWQIGPLHATVAAGGRPF
jgi:hypothetical protein